MMKVIATKEAPAAVGPYSQAILHNSKYTMELSGQLGVDPDTGKLAPGGVTEEAEQALDNIEAILLEIGWSFDNLVKVRIFLAEMSDYKAVNEIYAKRFKGSFPARIAMAVKGLPLGAAIEIEGTAAGDIIKNA